MALRTQFGAWPEGLFDVNAMAQHPPGKPFPLRLIPFTGLGPPGLGSGKHANIAS